MYMQTSISAIKKCEKLNRQKIVKTFKQTSNKKNEEKSIKNPYKEAAEVRKKEIKASKKKRKEEESLI